MDCNTCKWILLLTITFLLKIPFISSTMNYRSPYYEESYPVRRPFYEGSRNLSPQLFFSDSLRQHPLWEQFWEVYDYDGPLQQSGSPVVPAFVLGQGFPSQTDYFRRQPHSLAPDVREGSEEAYQRYKDYFFRRFENNFNS